MYPEENTACQPMGMAKSARSVRETLQDTRPSELTEIFEQVGTNRNRVGMMSQRLRDFLQRTKGNFPMAEGSAVKRPGRQGTLGQIYDVAREEADILTDIEQYLNMLEEIG